jgi:uncharacterized protein
MNGMAMQAPALPAFHVMTKPRGAICNLDCTYCYFLSKERLYPNSDFRMTGELLESYVRQYIEAQCVPEVTFAWQGGEPTLMGLDFYRQVVALQAKYCRPGMTILNTLQTNGVLLDDEWCHFFHEYAFLIGLSIDGPRELHDAYRVDRGGQGTFDRVMRAVELLEHHRVEFNVLTTVHAANAPHALEVYRFLRDEVSTRFIQFIPIVERDNLTGFQEGEAITERSVTARQYGDFLIEIFEEWARHDVGRVYVQMFDVALAAWAGLPPGLCVFAESCGGALALEHTGDLYACDHYVEPGYRLGNIQEIPLSELAASPAQRAFGLAKRETLPRQCLECEVRFACHGGCPKDRVLTTADGEPGLNYLCEGYRTFFNYVDGPMRFMAAALRAGQAPASLMADVARREREARGTFARAGRNDPCPCGSGRKYKRCHEKATHDRLPLTLLFESDGRHAMAAP